MKKKKILLVIPSHNSFIDSDTSILSSEFEIVLQDFNWKNKLLVPLYFFFQIFHTLFYLATVNYVIIQFGGYWSLIPSLLCKILKKKSVILLHGTDCASLPQIPYGSLRKPLLRLACKLSYSFTSKILPVSESLVQVQNDYNEFYIPQGYLNHFPSNKTPYQVIHNGLDIDFWSMNTSVKKIPNRFIAVFNPNQFTLKGGDLILRLAQDFPTLEFHIAGSKEPPSHLKCPKNVTFLGLLTREELRTEYQKATYHFQLSMFEGFGLALCEAMLCGCIPIGSSVNMIPSIIGETGYILKTKNYFSFKQLIYKALNTINQHHLSQIARQQIVSKFPIAKRKKKLIETLNNL